MKFLWTGAVYGGLCMLSYIGNSSIPLSDIIFLFGLKNVTYFVQYLQEITFWILPLIFFQIFYGTYIYRHFCTASIYFFSRCDRRTSWFMKEAFHLYLFTISYLVVMLASGTAVTGIFAKVIIDKNGVEALFFYLLVYSLYLFVCTLGINLLAILFTSNIGFIVVEGINFFTIASYTIVGNFFAPKGEILQKYKWMLTINPFSYLVFSMHETRIDYVRAALLFGGMGVLLLAAGCIVVNKHNFIYSNMETGGN